jgi:hypothetical protein
MMRNWLAALLITLLLIFGSYVRLGDLGQGDFRVDELYQVLAAQSIARGEGPRLPSGEPYVRGLDVTHLVRYSFDAFGASEFSARLPSAGFGVIALFLFAAVLWAVGGPWIAVVGTALLAVYPEAVDQSRALRFYTYQLTLGILAFYTGWRALRAAGGRDPADRDRLLRQWGWAVATLAILAVAARVQVVSLSVLAGWLAIVGLAAIAELKLHGRGVWRRSMPVQLTGAVLLVLLLGVVQEDIMQDLLLRARSVPVWVLEAEGAMHPLAYYYGLSETYPLLLGLLPLILLAAVVRRPRLGLFATLWFVVPLFLHSFVLTWKGSRFVMVPMLGLFVTTAIAAAWAGEVLVDRIRTLPLLRSWQPARRRLAAGIVVAVVALTAFVTLPAFNQSRKMVGAGSSRWSDMARIIRETPGLEAVPLAHRRPLHPYYYWGRIDFVVGERRLVAATARTDGAWVVEYDSVGAPDRSIGAPVLPTPESIRAYFASADAVLIGTEENNGRLVGLTSELAATLQEEAEELCSGRCGTGRLYLWRLNAQPSVTSVDTPRPESVSSTAAPH